MPDSERQPLPPPALSAVPPVGLFALGGFATGAGMRLLDPLLPLLARDFGVPVPAVAGLVAGFVVAYGLVQIGAGPLGDRFGKARVACGALLLYGLCLLASAAASGLPMLMALRAASGFFAGAVTFCSCLLSIYDFLPRLAGFQVVVSHKKVFNCIHYIR